MRQEDSKKSNLPGIPQRVREARERRGLTQAVLGDKLGVSRSMIAQWETGVRKPWISTLNRLADALDVSYEWLAFGNEPHKSNSESPAVDASLLKAVHAAVKDEFEARDLDPEGLYYFQVVVAVYTIAHRNYLKNPVPLSPAFQATLKDSVLLAMGA